MFFTRMFSQTSVQTAFLVPYLMYFVSQLDPLSSVTENWDRTQDKRSLNQQDQSTVFDYIVVGSGSAGAILATRLSENPSLKVLLLEAGGIPSPLLNIPLLSFPLTNRRAHDWRYRTIPQEAAAFGLKHNVTYWPAGKVLGGSSSTNGLINIRGNVQGYDLLAARTGDPIWRLSNILKFYRKVENYNGYFDKSTHGKNGYLSIEVPPRVPATSNLLRAAQELGYPIRDPNANGPLTEGFAPAELYTKRGARSGTYQSPLKESMERPHLTVRKYSFVTKLLFRENSNYKVIGVEYERHGKMYTARANRETILCAGALSTPKILMLSGIGPKEHLQSLKIPVRANLPVGQRLQDKYGALVGPFIIPKGTGFTQYRDINLRMILQWFLTGTGQGSSERLEATYNVLSETAKKNGDTFAPDIHVYVMSMTPQNPEEVLGHSFNFNDRSLEYYRQSAEEGDGIMQIVTMGRAVGTGIVTLRDKNPYSPLLIDPKYLQNPKDVRTLVEGIKFSVDLIEKTKPMQELGARLYDQPFPGCENYKFKSDEYYECLGRHTTATAYKYCGTAPIGAKDDPEAVVDSRFRVHGIKNLRVVDGSIMRIDEVNTNDVTMRMIGEFAAEIIKHS